MFICNTYSLNKTVDFLFSYFNVCRFSTYFNNSILTPWIWVLLRHKDLCITSLCYSLQILSILSYNKSYEGILDRHFSDWTIKRIVISNMYLRICISSVFSYNFFNHIFSSLIFIWRAIYKYISHIRSLYFFFSHLYLCSTFYL